MKKLLFTLIAALSACSTFAAPITGTPTVCVGSSTDLDNAVAGGTWSIAPASPVATINATTGVVAGLAAGTVIVTYTEPSLATVTATVTVNALPTVFNMLGSTSICTTSGCADATLSGSETGVNYQAYKNGVATGSPVAGTNSSLIMVTQCTYGANTYSTVATNASTGCAVSMAGTTVLYKPTIIDADPDIIKPNAYSCYGALTTTPVKILNASGGLEYKLYASTTVGGAPTTLVATMPSGAGGPLNFPVNVQNGYNYRVSIQNIAPTHTCPATMSNIVTGAQGHSAGLYNATMCLGDGPGTISSVFSPYVTGPGWTQITYSSSDPSVATVGYWGNPVTALAVGTTVVSVKSEHDCIGTATLTVRAPANASFSVNDNDQPLTGNSFVFNSTLGYSGLHTWAFGDATSSTAVTPTKSYAAIGTYTVTHTAYDYQCAVPAVASMVMTVGFDPISGGSGSGSGSGASFAQVCAGSTFDLDHTTPGGAWSIVPASSVATVNPTTGVVAGLTAGTVIVTYAVGASSVTTTVTVNSLPANKTVTASTSGVICSPNTCGFVQLPVDWNISYQAYRDGVAYGSPYITSSNYSTSFSECELGIHSFSVIATNPATGCSRVMNGGVPTTIKKPRTAPMVTVNSGYCSPTSINTLGTPVRLSSTDTGFEYTLSRMPPPTFMPVLVATLTGTGNPAAFSYTIVQNEQYQVTARDVNMSGCGEIYVSPFVDGIWRLSPQISDRTYCSKAQYGGVNSFMLLTANYGVDPTPQTMGYQIADTNIIAFRPYVFPTDWVDIKAPGTTTVIVATSLGCADTATVTITAGPNAGFTVNDDTQPITGNSFAFTPNVTAGTHSWTFGDASSSSATSPSRTYAAEGTYTVTHTRTESGCYNTTSQAMTVTPDGLGPITGTLTVCTGSVTDLGNATSGGTWSIAPGAPEASINATTGEVSGLAAGTVEVTYTSPSLEEVYAIVTVNASPNVYDLLGSETICTGSGCGTVAMDYTDGPGVEYQLYKNGVAEGSPIAGTSGYIAFASECATGVNTYSVTATDIATGCVIAMNGEAVVAIATTFAPVTADVDFCYIGSGTNTVEPARITSATEVGVKYYLMHAHNFFPFGFAEVDSVIGTGSPMAFTHIFANSSMDYYQVIALDAATGCRVEVTPVLFPRMLSVPQLTDAATMCVGELRDAYGLTGSSLPFPGEDHASVTHASWTSTNTSVAHVYPYLGMEMGTDTVSANAAGTTYLIETLSNGCSDTTTVTVVPVPSAAFTINDNDQPLTGNSFTFTAASSTGTHEWYFGDGGDDLSGAAAATHAYAATGTFTVTHTIIEGCYSTATHTVTVTPDGLDPISGGSGSGSGSGTSFAQVCAGSTFDLDHTTPGGAWSIAPVSAVATVNATTGVVAALSPGTVIVTYTVGAASVTTTVTVNALPSAYNVNGTASVCTPSGCANVTLSNSQTGISYQVFKNGTALGSPITGTGSSLPLASECAVGVNAYSVVATNTITGCTRDMTGTATISKPRPTPANISPAPYYCMDGSSPQYVKMVSTEANFEYKLYKGTSLLPSANVHVSTIIGTGGNMNFPTTIDLVGSEWYKVLVRDVSITHTCPAVEGPIVGSDIGETPVISGGYICVSSTPTTSGIIMHYSLGWPGSMPATYTWSIADTSIASLIPQPPTSFFDQIRPKIVGTTNVTIATSHGCSSTAILSVVPNTDGSFTVNDDVQPLTGNSFVFTPNGIGWSRTWAFGDASSSTSTAPSHTYAAAGTYTVTHTLSGSCSAPGIASMVITVTPDALGPITGTAIVCAGATTDLDNTTPGGTWSIAPASPVATVNATTGVVAGLSAGTVIVTYAVGAGSVTTTVTVNALPNAYNVNGTASVCTPSGCASVTLSNSQTGVNYQVYKNGVASGSPIAGTGSSLPLASECTVGVNSYSVIATNATTGCTRNMTGTATISKPRPTPASIMPNVYICSDASGVLLPTPVRMMSTEAGFEYNLYKYPTPFIGGPKDLMATITGTGSAMDFPVNVQQGHHYVVSVRDLSIAHTCPEVEGFPITGEMGLSPHILSNSMCLTRPTTNIDFIMPYSATGFPGGGGGLAYVVRNPAIASLSGAGFDLTPLSVGSTQVVVSLNNGCRDSALLTVVPGSDASFTVNANLQPLTGNNFVFTPVVSVGGHTWSFGDASSATTTAPSHSYAAAGSYTVTHSIAGTCPSAGSASQVMTVTDDALSAITGSGSGSGLSFDQICVGATTDLDHPTPGGVWSIAPATTATIHSSTGVVTGMAAGTGIVTYTVGVQFVTLTVTVHALPEAAFTVNDLTQELTGNNFEFTPVGSTSGNTYNWDFGDATTYAGTPASHAYTAVNIYSVAMSVSVTATGCTNTSMQMVSVLSDGVGGGGGDGGLESESLGGLVSKVDFNRIKNSIDKHTDYTKTLVFQQHTLEGPAAKGTATQAVSRLQNMLPASLNSSTTAMITSPAELTQITKAVDVFALDYVAGTTPKAVVLGITTLGKPYSHTKSICDRFRGGTLLYTEPVKIKGYDFIRFALRQPDGSLEFCIAFDAGKSAGRNTFHLQTSWLIGQYKGDDSVFNFQAWATDPENTVKLVSSMMDNLNGIMKVEQVDTAFHVPPAYMAQGRRNKGSLDIKITNTTPITSAEIRFDERVNEFAKENTLSVPLTLKLGKDNIISIPIGDGYEYPGYLYLNGELVDAVYMADGNWSLDYDETNTNVSKYTVVNDPGRIYIDNEYPLYRGLHVKAESKDYMMAYKFITSGNEPVDLSGHRALKFTAKGKGKMKVILVKDGITKFAEQYSTTVTLDQEGKEYAINFADFTSTKKTAFDASDVKAVVFSWDLSGNQDAFEFQASRLAFSPEDVPSLKQLRSKAMFVSPNPSNGVITLRFNSEITAEYDLAVVDVTGRVVYKQKVAAAQGANSITVTLPRELQRPAIYHLSMGNENTSYSAAKLSITE